MSFRFRLSLVSGFSTRNRSRGKFCFCIEILLLFFSVLLSRLFCNATDTNGPSSGIDRKLILDSSLKFVPRYGWSVKALEAGAKSVELPGVVHGLFPSGGIELVEHFEFDCNAKLIEYLEEVTTRKEDPYVCVEKIYFVLLNFNVYDLPEILSLSFSLSLKGGRLVQAAVEERLQMLIPYIDTWPQVSHHLHHYQVVCIAKISLSILSIDAPTPFFHIRCFY